MEVMGIDALWLIGQTALAIVIALIIGKVHEYFHVREAKKLGYKITGFAFWKNEVDIAIKPDDPNVDKIARAPYYYMIPLSIILIPIGYFVWQPGIIVAGIGSLIMHSVSIFVEGREGE